MSRFFLYTIASVALLLVAIRAFLPAVIDRNVNAVEEHATPALSPATIALHQSLFIIDLHSDSLLWRRNLAKESTYGHMDVPRLQRGNVGLQVFSATTKSPRGQNYDRNTAGSDNITILSMAQGWPVATWNSLFARAQYQLDKLHELVFENNEDLIFIATKRDLETLLEARASNPHMIGAMFLIEGAHPLEGELDNLDKLQKKGLHFVGLTHFFDNKIGGSLHGVSQSGLTEFGKAVVKRAEQLNMTIDIAHASPQMVKDVLAITSRPVILSHGGFKGSCDTSRNLNDDLMQAIAAKGGLIGVGYWEAAVCDYSPAGIVKSIRYGIALLGLEHIALGSDFDGATTTLFDTSEIALLTQAMLDQGFTAAEIRAVMGGNARRFLLQQLPAGSGRLPSD